MTGKVKAVSNFTIVLTAPNEVTNSKHAKLIKGMLKTTVNPRSLAADFLELLHANEATGTLSYMISEGLRRFPKRNYSRFGDRNNINSVSRLWFSEAGTDIDVQADILTEHYGRYITTDAIIEHVSEFKPGEYRKPLQNEVESILSEFNYHFGFKLTGPYARFLIGTGRDESIPF